MHIAAALTTNLISIHTWTNPRRVGPYNAAASIWKNGAVVRVSDLDSANVLGKGRPFRREDVPAVADLAMSVLAQQPVV